jgi:hypothetical protein
MPRDAAPPQNGSAQRDENLDVVRTSRDQENGQPKGSAAESALDPHLSVVCPFLVQPSRQRKHRGPYQPKGSKCISVPQATNIVEAVKFAKSIGLPLAAHLTIHWSGTVAFDDPDGARFAKVREGLNKVLFRRGIPAAWAWCRECKAHTDIVHCHLLFHLPSAYRTGAKLAEVQACLERLVDRHGDGILGEFAVKLTIHPDPDGLYLIKGGNRDTWEQFKIRREWRHSQGVIHGKRCGTTENIGRARRLAMAQNEVNEKERRKRG